jgi:hypothetical protein
MFTPYQDGSMPTRSDLDEQIRNIDNPKLRDEVQTRVDRRLAQDAQAKTEKENTDFEQAFTIASDPQNQQGLYNPRVVTIMSTLPASRQDQLKTRFAKDNAPQLSDPKVAERYYALKALVGTPAFVHADLMNDLGTIPMPEWKELVAAQEEQRKSGDKGPKIVGVTTSNEIVGNSLKQLDIDATSAKGSQQALDFRTKFDVAEKQWSLAHGNKLPSTEEKQAIAKVLAGDYITNVHERSIFNPFRWFGDTSAGDSAGPLYTQPDNVVSDEVRKAVVFSQDKDFTPDHVTHWVKTFENPTPDDIKKLARWRDGIGVDGKSDPSLVDRYLIIRAAIDAANRGE